MMATLHDRLVEGESRSQRVTLRADAESALAVAQARLAEFQSDPGGIYVNSADLERIAADPLAGWTPPDGAVVSVKIRDEGGLFNLNTTNTIALKNLFMDAGVSDTRAAALADCLADWVNTGNNARPLGAGFGAYDSPALPADRPLRVFGELRRVQGFDIFFNDDGTPNDLGRQLAVVTTCVSPVMPVSLSTSPLPNINTASEDFLNLLASHATFDVSGTLAFRTPLNYPDDRSHPGVFRSAGDLTRVNASADLIARVAFASRGVRVIVTASKGDLRYTIDAVLTAGSTAEPVIVGNRVDEALISDEGSGYAEGSSSGVP